MYIHCTVPPGTAGMHVCVYILELEIVHMAALYMPNIYVHTYIIIIVHSSTQYIWHAMGALHVV